MCSASQYALIAHHGNKSFCSNGERKHAHFEDRVFILRSYDNARNYGERLALPEFEACLRPSLPRRGCGKIAATNFGEYDAVRTTASA